MITFTSYGGSSGDVTGSKHLLKIDNEQYLLDCGMFQGSQENELRNLKKFEFDVSKIKAVLLSHAHIDHCGEIPKLIKEGYNGNIYCTSATRDLTSIVLMDSAKINSDIDNPVYNENDVLDSLYHFRCHAYGKTKTLSDKIRYTAYDAGHILGSSMFSIDVKHKRSFLQKLFKKGNDKFNVLFTGDLGRENNPITNDPATDMPAPDYIIMESTYGNRLHQSIPYSINEMTRIINDTINRNGKVIIPAFAIERAQEIIYYLKVLMKKKKIPKIPVYVDSPMTSTATGVFSIHPECFNHTIKDQFITQGKNPFSVSTLHIIKDNTESIKIAKSKKSCIVIAASGMCEAGRIINHLKYGLNSYNNTILTVGYMSPGTLGYKLVNGDTTVTINGKEIFVKASVESISAFSAHADYKEVVSWLSKIDTSKLKKILLVHGDNDGLKGMQQHLTEAGYKSEIVENSKAYMLKN